MTSDRKRCSPEEIAELRVLARRLAARLEKACGDGYHDRLARACALGLCDALDELAGPAVSRDGASEVTVDGAC